MRVFNKQLQQQSGPLPPFQLHPFAAERMSSEVLAHYFFSKNLPQQQEDSRSINLNNLSEEEILARLDKVDKDTVARVFVDRLINQAPKWAKEILKHFKELDAGGVDIPPSTKEEEQKKRQSRGAPPERNLRAMLTVFKYLEEIGMMEKLDQNDPSLLKNLQAHASMFTVEKAGSEVTWLEKVLTKLRIITDAREANLKTSLQSSYNIFTMDALFQCVSNVFHHVNKSDNKKFYCINTDLRHWFHQLRLPAHLKNLFKIKCGSSVYRMRTLPMGWYLSPSFAQTMTWSFLLGKADKSETLPYVDLSEVDAMPQWIPFTSGLGGIFVLQDNIFVVTDKEEIAVAWRDRMIRRASSDPKKGFNLEFKEKNNSKLPEIEVISGDSATVFDGVEFGYGWWSTISKQQQRDLFGEKREVDWKFTHREIAGMLGEILWSHRVRRIKSLYNVGLMKIFGINTPTSVDKWDEENTRISKQQLLLLRELLKEAREHIKVPALAPWYPDPKQTYSYAADASMEEKAEFSSLAPAQVAICARLGDRKWKWKNKMEDYSYIGEAELEGIIWCVRNAVQVSNGKATSVLVATDSLCAKGWVERMYSDRPKAQELLKELDEYLTGRHPSMQGQALRISCIYVRTDHNIADVPSRTSQVAKDRVTEGYESSWVSEPDGESRMLASSVLLRYLQQLVRKEGVIQGREAIRNARVETENPKAKEISRA